MCDMLAFKLANFSASCDELIQQCMCNRSVLTKREDNTVTIIPVVALMPYSCSHLDAFTLRRLQDSV